MDEKIQKRRLEWLGHLARMQDHRLPKSVLFGWLPQPRPWSGHAGDGGMRTGHAGDGGMWPRRASSRLILRMMSGTRQLQLRGMDGGQGVEKVSRGTDRSKQQQEQE